MKVKSLGLVLLAPVAAVVVVLGCYGLFVALLPPVTVSLRTPVRQDDFLYTAVGVAKTADMGLGPARVRANGRYYVVAIRVQNEAKRVVYQWRPDIVYVVDAEGRRYDYSREGQRAFDGGMVSRELPAGASATYNIVFDLPKDVHRPMLAYWNGILMGDALNGLSYAKARIPLE